MQGSRPDIRRLLLGKPLHSKAMASEKLSRLWGFPIMASDAVSSVAYAMEEILLVLVPAIGFAAINYLGTVSIPIILLLVILVVSYTQIINHYANGGGAYIVSAENLGRRTSLVAAASLIIDYIMTVAVSISSATAALCAAFPAIAHHNVLIAIVCLTLITLINLRGARESSKVFSIPTYIFILIMGCMIGIGIFKMINGTLTPISYVDKAVYAQQAWDGVLIVLILRAFSSGCSALTGVEAVSNAVPVFKEPSQKHAKHILFMLAGTIIYLFGGSVLVGMGLKVVPVEGDTVLSQIGAAIFGNGVVYYILQFSTMLILLLAANTAYTGLPTLLAILGKDGFMPRQFTQRGFKLGFSNGIMFIYIIAGLLLIVFSANTHHLIPLYSVGVFLSFTLSQFGMFMKWIRGKEKGWKHKAAINGVGALITAITMVIVFSTKFVNGAWMLAIAIPSLAIVMNIIKNHYDFVSGQLRISDDEFAAHYHKSISMDTNPVVVLVASISRSTLKSLNYANKISSNVTALHISMDDSSKQRLQKQWKDLNMDIPLAVLEAPFRNILDPIEQYITLRESKLKHGEDLTIVLIKFVKDHFYDNVLHNQTTFFIQRMLQKHRNVATILVPYIYKHTMEGKEMSGME